MAKNSWKISRDPLYRGDSKSEVSTPTPSADSSIVRHILYLEGYGRETPYLSCTENPSAAAHFAGSDGKTYVSYPRLWREDDVKHWPRKELLQLLRGRGKGKAVWPSAYEVMRAHQYVEEWQEHLADFTDQQGLSSTGLRNLLKKTFY